MNYTIKRTIWPQNGFIRLVRAFSKCFTKNQGSEPFLRTPGFPGLGPNLGVPGPRMDKTLSSYIKFMVFLSFWSMLYYIFKKRTLDCFFFKIIRTRGMICDESALKFFESPMIILYGSLRFSRFMCPRILILFHFKTLKNI